MEKVRWTARALADLQGIHDFIARDSPQAAQAVATRIVDTTERLAELPLSGRRLPESPDSAYREAIVAGYRVLYRPDNEVVRIACIVHGRRLLTLPDDD